MALFEMLDGAIYDKTPFLLPGMDEMIRGRRSWNLVVITPEIHQKTLVIWSRLRSPKVVPNRKFTKKIKAPPKHPQKAPCGGIPDPFLEPLTRSWSHFVGVHRQILTTSLKN